MDELALLKDMADRTPLPTAAELAPARARLTAAVHTPTALVPDRSTSAMSTPPADLAPARGRPARRRLLISGAAVIGLAAAITFAVSLGGLEPVGVAPAKANAAEILHQAADAARTLPDTPPRPDQFIYTKTQSKGGDVREAWLSADGTHDGLIRQQGENIPLPGCRDGKAMVVKGDQEVPGVLESCEPNPAYRPGLPTDAAAMRQYLIDLGGDMGESRTNSLGKNILYVVGENYVGPASLAALWEAVADLDPGLKVVDNVQDAAGRPGVGVSWTYTTVPMTLVFDKDTYAFLGFADSETVVQQAFVDVAGQRP
jgi:hypothetical protein